MTNRKERRKAAKQLTPKNIEQIVFESVNEALRKERYNERIEATERLHIWIVMTAYTLNYKLGLGKKRLPEIIDTILFNIDSFRTGQLALTDYDEIKQIVKDLGVDVDNSGGNK